MRDPGLLAPTTVRRFTCEEFERLAKTGIIGPDERVELLDGRILVMPPTGPDHDTSTLLVTKALERAFGRGFTVRPQLSLAIARDSLPVPDVAVVRGGLREFARTHPTTAELVVEIARSSLPLDRGDKAKAYARAGIPEYWVLDLVGRALEVRREPTDDGYANLTRVAEGEVRPLGARRRVKVLALLP